MLADKRPSHPEENLIVKQLKILHLLIMGWELSALLSLWGALKVYYLGQVSQTDV